MPYYAIFHTPLRKWAFFSPLDEDATEYSAELDAETDEEAREEAEREFEPRLLAIHWYPTREKVPADGRTVIDYEDEAIEAARREEEGDEDDDDV